MRNLSFSVLCLLCLSVSALAADKPQSPAVNADRIQQHITELSKFGTNPEGGVSRVAFSDADIAFYRAQVFAERKGAPMTEATPRLLAWRERVVQRRAVRQVTTTRVGFGPSSSAVNVRPRIGRMPNTFGKSYVTASPSARSAPASSARLMLVWFHSAMASNARARCRHRWKSG